MKIKRNYLNTLPLLTAFTLLPLAYPAMATPFHGVETGAFISDVLPFHFPIATDGVSGEGDATYLGHYAMTGGFVANVLLGMASGTFTMTAADGDSLFLDVRGHVIQGHPSEVLWNNTITGGTGRFKGATGSFTSQVQLDAAVGSQSPNPYTATLKGTISNVPDEGSLPTGLVVAGLAVSSSLVRRRSVRAGDL